MGLNYVIKSEKIDINCYSVVIVENTSIKPIIPRDKHHNMYDHLSELSLISSFSVQELINLAKKSGGWTFGGKLLFKSSKEAKSFAINTFDPSLLMRVLINKSIDDEILEIEQENDY